jgi:myo-inositol-1(or 4)-monophosphatase
MISYRSTELMTLAMSAARDVAPMLLEAFRTDVDIETKADMHDLVTEYDSAAERRIAEVLLDANPESAIVGEEGGRTGDAALTWYVDPIDGTANFARGIAFWCVSIGATVDGERVAGAVYDPVADLMFHADGSGAFLNGRPLHARGFTAPSRSTMLAHFPMPADLEADEQFAMTEYANLVRAYSAVRNKGSGALSLAHVAAGWGDVTLNFGTNSWDVAAGSFILEQAGGTYVGYSDGSRVLGRDVFLAPHYLGLVRDADTTLLEPIMRKGSVIRDEHTRRREAVR